MIRVFNFSGGKTSAYMVIKHYRKGDLVIFCDTGREHPKTYKFINDFEAFENIQVIRLKNKGAVNPFTSLLENKKYNLLPNRVRRFCTEELKIKTCKRYLRTIGIQSFENYIGFRYDEPKRVKSRIKKYVKVIDKFPLYDENVTKDMINAYWETRPYNLEIPSILGNCTLCFMKGKSAIINILMVYPELAEEWINDEKNTYLNSKGRPGSGKRYFPDVTIQELKNIAQSNLFKPADLKDITPAFNCACTT